MIHSSSSGNNYSIIMEPQDVNRIIYLLVITLLCYRCVVVVDAFAEQQRVTNAGDGDNYLRESTLFDGSTEASSVLKSSSISRQRDQQQDPEETQLEDRTIPHYSLRYKIKEINQDNDYNRPQTNEQWELAKIGELLEALSMTLSPSPAQMSIVVPEQVRRSGHTYQPFTGADRRQQQQQLIQVESPPAFIRPANSYNRYAVQPRRQTTTTTTTTVSSNNRRQQAAPLIVELAEHQKQPSSLSSPGASSSGSSWIPQASTTRTMAGTALSDGGLRTTNANRRSHANPRHTSDTAEVAIHTPLHSSSVSDYEWKRVENSRWNNLRGMWGKRSVPIDGGADIEDGESSSSGGTSNGNGYIRSDQDRNQRKRSPRNNDIIAKQTYLSQQQQHNLLGNFM